PAADSDRETRDPATVREQQAERAQGSANAEDRESRRLRVLDEIAPVEGQGRAGRERECGSGRAAHRRCPTSGRQPSAASPAMPTRGRSPMRSKTTYRFCQRGRNLRLNASKWSSWNVPFSWHSSLRCTRGEAESSPYGASAAAKGEKFNETRSYPWLAAQSTVSATSHSWNPFGVVRRRGIDDSESALPAGETARWKKPATAPEGSRPSTKTASRPPTSKSESNSIVNPRCGWEPRQRAATSASSSASVPPTPPAKTTSAE